MTVCEWILLGVGLFLALVLLLSGRALKLAYDLGASRESIKHIDTYIAILDAQVEIEEQLKKEAREYGFYGELVSRETLTRYTKLENDLIIPLMDKASGIEKGDENENEL